MRQAVQFEKGGLARGTLTRRSRPKFMPQGLPWGMHFVGRMQCLAWKVSTSSVRFLLSWSSPEKGLSIGPLCSPTAKLNVRILIAIRLKRWAGGGGGAWPAVERGERRESLNLEPCMLVTEHIGSACIAA